MFEITGILVINEDKVQYKQSLKLGFIPGRSTCCSNFNWRFADCLLDTICIINGIIRGEFAELGPSIERLNSYKGTIITYTLDEDQVVFRFIGNDAIYIEIKKQDKFICIDRCSYNGNAQFNGIIMNAAPIIIKHAPKIHNEIDKRFIVADEIINSFFSTGSIINKSRKFANDVLNPMLESNDIVFSDTFTGNFVSAMCNGDVLAILFRYETKLDNRSRLKNKYESKMKSDLDLGVFLNNNLRRQMSQYTSDKGICYLNIRKEDFPNNMVVTNDFGHHFDKTINKPLLVESDNYIGTAIPLTANKPTQEIMDTVGEVMTYVMQIRTNEITIDEVPKKYRDTVQEMIDLSKDENSFCLGLAFDPVINRMIPLTPDRLESLHKIGAIDESTYQTAQQLIKEFKSMSESYQEDDDDDNYYEEDDDYANN